MKVGAPLGALLGAPLGMELGTPLGVKLGFELGAIDILGPELGTELGCSLGGKIALPSICATFFNFATYSPEMTASSVFSAASAVSKPEQAKAVMVHGTFQHIKLAVSTPSTTEQGIFVPSHSTAGGGQVGVRVVDRNCWRPLDAPAISGGKSANAFAVLRAPRKRQKKLKIC
jgi:hypothetical protein